MSTRLASRHRGPLLPPPRQRVRLLRSRAPSIDRLLPKSRACARRFLVGTRHRCLGFAAEDPASGALSPPRCSRPEWLDPTSVPEALHPGSRRAKRRLSTSAIYCDPRAHPTDRPNPAHRACGRPPAQLSFRATVFRRRNGLRVAVRITALPIEMSRARGLLSSDSPIERHGSSRRDRSRWELHPNPIGSDTSCRKLVATPAGGAVAVGPPAWRDRLTSSPGMPCSRKACLLGPPRATPREGDHATPHPRCLLSPDHPVRGGSRRPQAVPSLWTVGRRLFDPRARTPVTRVLGPRTRARVMDWPESQAHRCDARSASDDFYVRSVRGQM